MSSIFSVLWIIKIWMVAQIFRLHSDFLLRLLVLFLYITLGFARAELNVHNLRVSFIMSRVGKLPISIPGSVKFQVDGSDINLTGPKGFLSLQVCNIVVNMSGNQVTIMPSDESSVSRAMWGLFRSLLFNAVKGVSEGWTRRLEINGVGYRATASEGFLVLSLGYSHEVICAIPPSIEIKCEKPTLLLISGCDKQLVGQVAAEIRQLRKPEPYKGKGIKYDEEVIRRKEGKKK